MNTEEKKANTTVYQNFRENIGNKEISEVLMWIKDGKFESEVKSIRYAFHSGDTELGDTLKKSLLAFTCSGTFAGARQKENLTAYSQLICLDFDGIPFAEVSNLKEVVANCSYTHAAFVSPSGMGLKVFVRVKTQASNHGLAYCAVGEFYERLTGYQTDPACKDITRLCFVSFDPECYTNFDSEVFTVLMSDPALATKGNAFSADELLERCLKLTENISIYQDGNRNNFVFLFASNCNRFGVVESITLKFSVTHFDLPEREISAIIRSAYKNHSAEFAKFAESVNSEIYENIFTLEQVENQTPTIPESVYEALPRLLKDGTDVFPDNRQKDIYLTTALAILSGCLPNVKGLYFGKTVYPNLFSFVLAPPASNKGSLTLAKDLARTYHSETVNQSTQLLREYEFQLRESKSKKQSDDSGEGNSSNIQPPFKVVLIPANASSAAIYQHLQLNDGIGIICETEADTMGQAFKQEWGSYSTIMRQAFHHETISYTRKTNREYIEIPQPKLSIALTGTPNQITNIIASAEDGLFSRFIFYTFKAEAKWQDPSPYSNTVNMTEHFYKLSERVYDMVQFYEKQETWVELTKPQWDRFNSLFDKFLLKIQAFLDGDADSVVKRLGLITYRLCMILSAIRNYENRGNSKNLICTEDDFNSAIALATTYLEHSLRVFENLPKQKEQVTFKFGDKKQRFFEALPQKFLRKEAVEIAKTFQIAERTVDDFLSKFSGKLFRQVDYGEYEKMTQLADYASQS